MNNTLRYSQGDTLVYGPYAATGIHPFVPERRFFVDIGNGGSIGHIMTSTDSNIPREYYYTELYSSCTPVVLCRMVLTETIREWRKVKEDVV